LDAEEHPQRAPTLRIALLDVSDSVTRVRSAWPALARTALESEARAAAGAGDAFAVLAFAEEIVRWHGPAAPESFAFDEQWLAGAPARRGATDLAAALLAADRLARSAERAAHVRILSDGAFTGSEPTAQLARVHAELVPLPAPDRFDPWLRSVEAAAELEPGAPLALRVEWERDGFPADSALSLRIRGLPEGERTWTLDAQSGPVQRLELGSMGSRHLDLDVELLAAGDAIPENNALGVRVRARGALQIALAFAKAQEATARTLAASWGAEPGLGVELVENAGSGPAAVRSLAPETDLLVTLDLDPRSLEVGAVAPLLARGGGWLAAGGSALLAGLAARDERSAASYLPCVPDDDDRPRDVLLAIDVSGSMDGESFDAVRNAAIGLVERLRLRDELTLQFFTDRLGEAIALGRGAAAPGSGPELARRLLEARRPSGPTDLPAVLEELVAAREAKRTQARIVVLTDGRDQRGLPSAVGRTAVALERLSEAGAKVRVLASGPDPDLEFLRGFERPELGCSVARLGADVAAALERASNGERWDERARAVRVAVGSASAAAQEQRLALERSPEVVRTLRLRARDGDAVLLEDDEAQVLAAVRPAGAGACAVLATLPGPEGSPAWAREPTRWLPWVRALARGRAGAPPAPFARWSAPRRLELGPFEPALGRSLRAQLIDGGGVESELPLAPVRSAAFPVGTFLESELDSLPRPGSRVRLVSRDDSAGALPEVLALPPTCPEEFLRPPRALSFGAPSAAAGRASGGSWRGWVALGLGLVLVTLGAVAGTLSGRSGEA